MATGIRNVWRGAKKVNDLLLPRYESFKTGRISKPLYYIYYDYKTVLVDFLKASRKKPISMTFKIGILGGLAFVWSQNPDENSFKDKLLENSNNLLLLSDTIRNHKSDEFVQKVMKYDAEERLQRYNLGLISVVVFKPSNGKCDLYEVSCEYLQPRWIYMWERVVDIGILGKWYYLEKCMVDFDVNDEEFAHLPEELRK